MLTITRWIVTPSTQKIDVYYSNAYGATNLYLELSEAETPLNDPAWSNDDLIAAVAAKLGVSVEDVRIDPVPPPPAPEPAVEGEGDEA